MSAMPNLSRILDAVGDAGSRLYDAFWRHVVSAFNTARNFVMAHPRCTCAIVILLLGVLLAQPLAKGVVGILGFTAAGVLAGSPAALFQASHYGGFVPAGSMFSFLQSFGAL